MNEEESASGSPPPPPSADPRYGSVISSRPLPLDIKRPIPWNRWVRKAVHYWRYGYSHPDEDLLGVIDAVGDALYVQVNAARAILSGGRAEQAAQIKDALDDELRKALPDFSTLLSIEARINALYPPALAKRRQWVLRERFERVAPASAVQSWLRARAEQAHAGAQHSEPAQPGAGDAERPATGKVDGSGARDGNGGKGGGGNGGAGADDPASAETEADTQTLLGYIHTSYLMTIGREKAVRDLKRWLLMRFWLFIIVLLPILLVVWILLWLNDAGEYWGLLLGLFLIAAAGRAGATTSIINRLQTAISRNILAADPIVELTALRTGKNEISMALVSASIFALLMWAFFASGVPRMIGLDGGLFPRAIAADQRPAAEERGGQTETETETDTETETGAEGDKTPSTATPSTATPSTAEQTSEKPAPDAPAPVPTAASSTESAEGQPGADVPGLATAAPPSAPGAAAPAQPSQAGAEAGAAARERPDAALTARLALLAEAVEGAERAYRDHMGRLREARGLDDWFNRRAIRRDARAAISQAILTQEEAIALLDQQQRIARSSGNQALAERWDEALTRARAGREALRESENRVMATQKPTPGLTCEPGKNCNPFPALAAALRLVDESDFFKMLLWAFIAGFAERFVPDMLDRVVLRSRGAALEQSRAAGAVEALAAAPAPGPPPASPPPPGDARSGP